ncbi:MAG: 2Fe-2S iron-sulfur cluster binding domain-containing protein, partial [Oscillospiraceae bacterium]|nr:2Fe-2S iron-sulfur cluster binding domain-containing protein [Oscillospiraceae bacterium]
MKVKFLPSNIEVEVSSGVTIMDALIEADLQIDAPCGGRGVCRKCKVDIVDGAERKSVLACMTKVESDLVVDISKQDEGHRILMGGISRAVNLMPAVKAFAVEVPKPSTKDLRSCWDRLKDAVAEKAGVPAASIKPDPAVVSGIYDTLTSNDFKVEALLFGDEIVAVRAE